ncbi:MAG TPA: hypothetical protein VNH17_17620, partial [Streptosporangiaceae bacterium]|nr:hypothetical protein [Streptosporangiaceae bacterium]
MDAGQVSTQRSEGKKNAAKAAARELRDEHRDQREPGWGDQAAPAVLAEGPVADGVLPADRFLDREESWLRFNQ